MHTEDNRFDHTAGHNIDHKTSAVQNIAAESANFITLRVFRDFLALVLSLNIRL